MFIESPVISSVNQVVTVNVLLIDALFVTFVKDAEMVTDAFPVTLLVVIGKVCDPTPAGTVTVAGTEAQLGLELNRYTTVPPVGALLSRVIVPLLEVPP